MTTMRIDRIFAALAWLDLLCCRCSRFFITSYSSIRPPKETSAVGGFGSLAGITLSGPCYLFVSRNRPEWSDSMTTTTTCTIDRAEGRSSPGDKLSQ
jgi:hypothetical protein